MLAFARPQFLTSTQTDRQTDAVLPDKQVLATKRSLYLTSAQTHRQKDKDRQWTDRHLITDMCFFLQVSLYAEKMPKKNSLVFRYCSVTRRGLRETSSIKFRMAHTYAYEIRTKSAYRNTSHTTTQIRCYEPYSFMHTYTLMHANMFTIGKTVIFEIQDIHAQTHTYLHTYT